MPNVQELTVTVDGDVSKLNEAMANGTKVIVNFAAISEQSLDKVIAAINKANADIVASIGKMSTQVTKQLQSNSEAMATYAKQIISAIDGIPKEISDVIDKGYELADLFKSGGPLAAGVSAVTILLKSFITHLESIVTAEDIVKAATQAMIDTLDKANGKAEAEIVSMQGLVNITMEHANSISTRTAALKELQKEYPGYLDNITLEDINSDKAAAAVERLRGAILRKAEAQAIEAELTIAYQKKLRLESESLDKQVDIWDLAIASIKNLGITSGTAASLTETAVTRQKDQLKGLSDVIDVLTVKLQAIQTTQAASGDFIDTKKPKKEVDEVLRIMDRLAAKRKEIATDILTNDTQKVTADIRALQDAIRGLEVLKQPARTKPLIDTLIGDITSDRKRLLQLELRDALENISDGVKFKSVKAPISVAPTGEIDKQAADRAAAVLERSNLLNFLSRNNVTSFYKKGILVPITPQINNDDLKTAKKQFDGYVGYVTDAVTSITKGIGDVFTTLVTTGTLSFSQLGNAISGIISRLVSAVAEAAALAFIFSVIFPGASPISGAGFGQLFKNFIIPHADGGIFTKPTLLGNHLFGEAGPEAIVPLNRMNEFTSISDQMRTVPVEVSGVVRGQDIFLSNNRATRRNRRNG